MDGADDRAAPIHPGLIESLRGLLATLVQLIHARVELFTTELEEEMHRVAMLLLWGAVALFFGGLFVLMLALTVVIVFWDEHRVLAAGLMSGLFLIVVLIAVVMLRSILHQRQGLLASSRDELRRDRDALSEPSARRP